MIEMLLKEVLEQKGISKYRLALLCGLPYRTVCNYYSNDVQMLNKDHLVKFCEILDCDLSDLVVYRKENKTDI